MAGEERGYAAQEREFPVEQRDFAAEELTSQWLTVEQVMGRRGVRRHGPGAAAAAADPLSAPAAAAVVPLDEHRALNVVTAGGYPPAPARAATAEVYQHPAPDLVAADTALASRWFTADAEPGKLAGRTVLLPFTALAELATWPERLLWGHSRAEDLSRWTEPGRVIGGDDTVCRIWARITVAAQRAGSVPASEEAWIAAGCLSYGLPLATQHKRRYQYFAARYGLRLL